MASSNGMCPSGDSSHTTGFSGSVSGSAGTDSLAVLTIKIGIVGYWATSISTVRTTVLSEKVIKTDLFSDLDITFRILDI